MRMLFVSDSSGWVQSRQKLYPLIYTLPQTNKPNFTYEDDATAAYAVHQQEAERALAACRAYAARARAARFPTPQVLEVQVGRKTCDGCLFWLACSGTELNICVPPCIHITKLN